MSGGHVRKIDRYGERVRLTDHRSHTHDLRALLQHIHGDVRIALEETALPHVLHADPACGQKNPNLATEDTVVKDGKLANALVYIKEGTLADDLPSVSAGGALAGDGIGLLALLVKAGLATTNSEARRHIQGGAVRVNDIAVNDEKRSLTTVDLTSDGIIKLSVGKKKHVLVKP